VAEAARLFPVDEDETMDAQDGREAPPQDNAPKGPVLKEVPAVEKSPRTAVMVEAIRIAEALVFAAESPIEESDIAKRLPEGVKVADVMRELRTDYEGRGVNLVRVAKKWIFRTAADLGWLLSRETQQQKKLSRAALETLAIVAYHQPVTRAEIEDIRGVAISKGTIDVLMETGWVRLRGRRKAPGRPVTYGTTDEFLMHFGLEGVTDLPGLDELKGAGLFDGRLPPGFGVPTPNDSAELTEDEEPLEEGDLLAFASEGVPEIDTEAGAVNLAAPQEIGGGAPVAEAEIAEAELAEGDTVEAHRESVETLEEQGESARGSIEAAMEANAEAAFIEPGEEPACESDAGFTGAATHSPDGSAKNPD
jgi:segregation and condensation protein B